MRLYRIVSAAAALLLTACADSMTEPKPRETPAVTRQIAAPPTADNNIHDVINTVIDAIKACRDDGWKSYTTTSGRKFRNELECILYASLGGALVPIAPPPPPPTPPVIASFTFDGTVGDCTVGLSWGFTAVFSGGTGVLTDPNGGTRAVTSGVQVSAPRLAGTWTLTVTGAGGTASSVLVQGPVTTGCDPGAIRLAPPTP